MKPFDICPCALPNASQTTTTGPREYLFEDPRDISRIGVTFKDSIPADIKVQYMRKIWPDHRIERMNPDGNPMPFGWFPIDDHYNTPWHDAAIDITHVDERSALITFRGLSADMTSVESYDGLTPADLGAPHEASGRTPNVDGYDVRFRRTLGIRIDAGEAAIETVAMYTESAPEISRLRVLVNAGGATGTGRIRFQAYNAEIIELTPGGGLSIEDDGVLADPGASGVFEIGVRHMTPAHRFCNDEGLLTFVLDSGEFTISIESLKEEGPIWYEKASIYITLADKDLAFEAYQASISSKKGIRRTVTEEVEQSLGGPLNGQPRPHAVPYSLGWKGSRHRFWLDPNGDIALPKTSVDWVKASDTPRFKNDNDGRFFFGFERWQPIARFTDPAPVIAYNINMACGGLVMEQKSYATPLLKSVLDELVGDDAAIAMVRFRFSNRGDQPEPINMPIQYSSDAIRVHNRLDGKGGGIRPTLIDDNMLPLCGRERLSLSDIDGSSVKAVYGQWHDERVLRCVIDTAMQAVEIDGTISLRHELLPGETCDALVKIPFIKLESDEEMASIKALDFDGCYPDMARFWREENRKGAQVITPEARLNALYASHLSHVHITDFVMPNDHYLINTSVGTSTYPNFSNESCMIIQELDQRGLHEEARRRLSVWLKYQSTVGLIGNFTDHDGVFYGAGGFECGQTYDQHHGWVMWYLCEHYFMTRDDEWMRSIAGSVIKGADWVFRQRRNTLIPDIQNSRGIESGFIPAGSLEDVADFFYWLSTNTMTWRGVNNAANALEAIGHPEAPRIRGEADEYRESLINGFNKACAMSPLVRLRDGRWVPHFPSRLYRRGRDTGWIREVLEGAVYLLISGLYDPNSDAADSILDDYLDNRYLKQPYAYVIWNPESNWFDYGGFSPQPNLLAGLMPHLDRDEPEVFIWMFFNAWCACYREEINAMVEHPSPILGFSNVAHPKTSDEANAVMWLRYMFVYGNSSGLYMGRAIPREWFSDGNCISAERVSTKYGDVSISYKSEVSRGRISASVDLDIRAQPTEAVVRMRHSGKLPIKSAKVNGVDQPCFDPVRGDIYVSGMNGHLEIEAVYE